MYKRQLREKLARGGLKALVGNRGWRKYLRVSGTKAEIDEGALKREARYDGKYVLLTDCDLPARPGGVGLQGSLAGGGGVPGAEGSAGAGADLPLDRAEGAG